MIEKLKSFPRFFRESKAELMKVTWPDRKTTTASTVVVLAVSIIVGLYLGALDVVFSWASELIL